MTEYQLELARLNKLKGQSNWTLYLLQLKKIMNKYSVSLSENNISQIYLELLRQLADIDIIAKIDAVTKYSRENEYNTNKKEITRIRSVFESETLIKKSSDGFLLLYVGQSKMNIGSRKVFKRLSHQFPKFKNDFVPRSGRWNFNEAIFYLENNIDEKHKIDFIEDVYSGNINQSLISFGQTVDKLTSVIEGEFQKCKNTILYFENFENNKTEDKEFFLEHLILELIEFVLINDLKIDKLKFYFEKEEDAHLFNNHLNLVISSLEIKKGIKEHLIKLTENYIGRVDSKTSFLKKEYQKNKSQLSSLISQPAVEFRKKFSANCDWLDERFARLYTVKDIDDSILILGESGTGKGFLAKLLHSESNRKNKPFFQFNCANVPESLIQSELFGHKKGAFTGAMTNKKGIFEEANGGILFLDEVGEASPEVQKNLLTAVDEKIIKPVGAEKHIRVDVKIIFATNQDLDEMVKQNTFRRDLLNRINRHQITLPALRERKEDIEALLYRFKPEFENKYNKTLEFTPDALNRLMTYDFPGNIRELQNILEQCIIYSDTYNLQQLDIKAIEEIIPFSKQIGTSLKLETFKQNLTELFLTWKHKKDISSLSRDIEEILTKMGRNKDRKSYSSFARSVIEPILARIYYDLYRDRTPGIIKDDASELIGLSWKAGDENSKLTQSLQLYPILEKYFN